MSEIAILGAGMMGSALCWPLTDNGHSVRLVGTHLDGDIISRCKKDHYHPTLNRTLPDTVRPYHLEQIDQAVERAQTIVCGVNSLGIRWIASTLRPLVRAGQRVSCVVLTSRKPAEIPLKELRMAERQAGFLLSDM